MDIVATIVTGVISGIIASVCFYFMMKGVKPKIVISSCMCTMDPNLDAPIYHVKFVNRSKKVITDLNYVLQYMEIRRDGVHTVKEIQPCKPKLKFIDKYDNKSKDANYAVRISYQLPKSEYELNENTKLIFTVIARDPDSGSTTCAIQEFKAENLVHGRHQTKESLEYLMITDNVAQIESVIGR